MKIFYGVQGTGNGHITRARCMVKALQKAGFDVDFLFSGRKKDDYFDMAVFGDCQYRTGLTFNVEKGKINPVKTVLQSHPVTFIHDVWSLDLSAYDRIICDFEPVTAWAAKKQGKPVLGLGHQYAFQYPIPKRGADWMSETVMRWFAPVNFGLGLHWHHFDQPILPPIIETHSCTKPSRLNKIMVYLPFEWPSDIVKALAPLTDFDFHVYSPTAFESSYDHIVYHPLSRTQFQNDLDDCNGVISNAGFELLSEALQLGKKILVKPLAGQMEQISNAAALKQLNYGAVMDEIETGAISEWLDKAQAVKVGYPNVAAFIAEWLASGESEMSLPQIKALWDKVKLQRMP